MTLNAAIEPAGPAEAERLLEVLTLAFSADPPTRWLWPDAGTYLEHFPRFARAFGGGSFAAGDALRAGFSGVALWLRPDSHADDDALIELVRETIAPERLETAFSVFEQMDACHPREPHWYLPMVGVDPAAQGGGLGSALLGHALRRCDAEGLPAYLEATSEGSARLYRRHGFEPLTEIRAGGCPPIVPMLRRSRRPE